MKLFSVFCVEWSVLVLSAEYRSARKTVFVWETYYTRNTIRSYILNSISKKEIFGYVDSKRHRGIVHHSYDLCPLSKELFYNMNNSHFLYGSEATIEGEKMHDRKKLRLLRRLVSRSCCWLRSLNIKQHNLDFACDIIFKVVKWTH